MSSSDAKTSATDVHTAHRANTTNGIRTSPPGMSPSQSNHSFSSLRSSHSFHSFHVPHIKFHSFHGNHEHSKSWQVCNRVCLCSCAGGGGSAECAWRLFLFSM